MESDSTVLLIRAVLVSIGLHVVILYLLTLFVSSPIQKIEFSNLNVRLISSAVSLDHQTQEKAADEAREEPVAANVPPHPQESPVIVSKQPQPVKKGEAVNNLISPNTVKGRVPGVDVQSEGMDETDKVTKETTPLLSSPSEEKPQKKLDLSWEGASAKILEVPDPLFTLPYDGNLPEKVSVSFSVQGDGTSVSVKIMPPGSGYLNLDQQIRSYVSSLIFESFGTRDQRRKGFLTLNLRHQESGGQ